MNWKPIRKVALAGVLATILAATLGAGPAVAQPVPIGPECNPTTSSAVLAAIASLGLPPGSKVQYLEVYQTTAGTYAVRPCVVTVP